MNKEIRKDNSLNKTMTKLKADKAFIPCPLDDGDELFPNGIFKFNITKMHEYIQKNIDTFVPEEVEINSFYVTHKYDDSQLESVDISKPIIIAEISPGRYNVIDGNHRVVKARRQEKKYLMAYRLGVSQHLKFLTSKKAYLSFIEYWNGKVLDLSGKKSRS